MGFRALGRGLFTVFIFLSLVSLFADMTYEGARSVFGSYAEVLGATALFASLAGIGEFLGYATRLLSGILAGYLRSSRGYWCLTFTGYALNLLAVPLLAFSGHWQLAILLIFLERIGKGLRAPARDVILAEVTEGIGRGKAFGFHEALDQAGAVLGPLSVSITLYTTNNSYPVAFMLLALPAAASMMFLYGAYARYPRLRAAEVAATGFKSKPVLGRAFWLYTASMSLVALGLIHWVNLSYYLKAEGLAPDYLIATMYLVAMLVDGLLAFPMGLIYDRVGLVLLLSAPLLSASIVPMLLMNNILSALVSSILWGAVMGMYEGTARAAIADILPQEGRAYGYGIFGASFGAAWMVGSMVYGYLYQNSVGLMIPYALTIESLALFALVMGIRELKKLAQGMHRMLHSYRSTEL